MNIIYISATTLPDAWYQALYKCIEEGREFLINKGSYKGQKRLEFDYITIRIKKPYVQPLLPDIPAQYNIPNPVALDYIAEYLPYLMTDIKQTGEDYTYGERIASQIQTVVDMYKNHGHRNNQMVIQIAKPSDIQLSDPPCLRHIDTRIQDNCLHFFPYFRSWDLWGGFPANLAAIELMKQYMASEIGVENGEIIASSKGLHLYDYTWKLAEIIRGKTIDHFKEVMNENKNT